MYVMKTANEIGTNTYSGLTCTGTSKYNKEADLRESVGCVSASTMGGPSDYSFKTFVSTTTAFLKKYSLVNGLITMDYTTSKCSGQYSAISVSFMNCVPYTEGDRNTTTAGHMIMNFTPTGSAQAFYGPANPNCTGTPLFTYNNTYSNMDLGKCSRSDDSQDNYPYNIQTTHFLMK